MVWANIQFACARVAGIDKVSFFVFFFFFDLFVTLSDLIGCYFNFCRFRVFTYQEH